MASRQLRELRDQKQERQPLCLLLKDLFSQVDAASAFSDTELREAWQSFGQPAEAMDRISELLKRLRDAAKAEPAVPIKSQQSPKVIIENPCRRGVRLKDLLDFFQKECGDIVYEDEQKSKPICMATKLAKECNLRNQKLLEEIGAGRKRRLEPNLYAVDELLIRPQTEGQKISMAELWWSQQAEQAKNPDGFLIEFFISHFWGEDFGEFMQSPLLNT
jgi:hypothetical protein